MEYFSSEDQDRVVQAISLAESKISGEIRLVVERKLHGMTAIEHAQHYFEKLGMTNTVLRNGVLLYIATEDHEFAIIGDAGINQKVPENFWEQTKIEMTDFFRKGELANGLIWGITHAAEQLVKFFPSRPDDINELPDEIYFGNN